MGVSMSVEAKLAKYWGRANGLGYRPGAGVYAVHDGAAVALSWAHIWDLYSVQIHYWIERLTLVAKPDLAGAAELLESSAGNLRIFAGYNSIHGQAGQARAEALTVDKFGQAAASVVGSVWVRSGPKRDRVYPNLAEAGRLLVDASFAPTPDYWPAIPVVLGCNYAFPVAGADWFHTAPAGSTALVRFMRSGPATIWAYSAALQPLRVWLPDGLESAVLILQASPGSNCLVWPALPLDFSTVGRYSLRVLHCSNWLDVPKLEADPLFGNYTWAIRAIKRSALFPDLVSI